MTDSDKIDACIEAAESFARPILRHVRALVHQALPKPALGTPDDLAAAIAKTPGAQKVYDGFTDAQRRDCVDWIPSAKRQATREKRIAEAAQWIGEGKRRNWKYEKC